MEADVVATNPLKWHGGKAYLAPWIIEHFPPHVHYVEPYFGGGAVLFAKPREWVEGHSEVVNDLNGGLMNFWRVMRDDMAFLRFRTLCEQTPFAQGDFERASWTDACSGSVHSAHGFFIRYRQSRQGLGKDFATLSKNRTRRGMNEQVSAWLTAVEGLPEAHERLKRVVILNDDALKVIKQEDSQNTFFYLDPPYLHETRATTGDYEHEMTEEQHSDLLELLDTIEGKFLLSGYHSRLYDIHADACGWVRHEKEIDNKASGKKSKERKVECLWANF